MSENMTMQSHETKNFLCSKGNFQLNVRQQSGENIFLFHFKQNINMYNTQRTKTQNNQRWAIRTGEDSSEIKSTDCSRVPEFGSQHPRGVSQSSRAAVSGDSMPSSDLYRHKYTCIHIKINKSSKNEALKGIENSQKKKGKLLINDF